MNGEIYTHSKKCRGDIITVWFGDDDDDEVNIKMKLWGDLI